MPVAVKICCIQSVAEAELAISHGATAVGLVGAMPSGPGPISDDRIAVIAGAVGDRALSVLLTSQTTPDGVTAHIARTRPRAVQLVDVVEPGTYDAIWRFDPGLAVFQVVHVRGEADVAAAIAAASQGCQILLDSGAPDARVRELGGTGRVHDWTLSRRIVEACPTPVWLAGGLKPGNVADAIARVGPHGVDLCSGLRPNGALDKSLLAAFMEEVRRT